MIKPDQKEFISNYISFSKHVKLMMKRKGFGMTDDEDLKLFAIWCEQNKVDKHEDRIK